jgi:predicted dehydrogenase
MTPVRIAIIGAGLIGVRHARIAAAEAECVLAGIADPDPAAESLASELNCRWFRDYRTLLDEVPADGVIVATPNSLHVPVSLDCVARGLHLLVEKPLADTIASARELVEAAEHADIHLLVGHHRRFNPAVEIAREIIQSGELGHLVAVSAIWASRKPDNYFNAGWRREPGGGPVLINLIHDIDCLRHLCGEISELQAITSSGRRGFAVEDTAALLIRFVSGTLGTITLSDVTPSPWSWEAASGDNPGIAVSGENCYRFLGSEAALDFPNLLIWRHHSQTPGDWSQPFIRQPHSVPDRAALPEQLQHFIRVIRGLESPRVSGRDGLATLAATLAVHEAALTRQPVAPAT